MPSEFKTIDLVAVCAFFGIWIGYQVLVAGACAGRPASMR